MKNCADYIQAAKVALGNPRMSDRELGVTLGGLSQASIATAKKKMSDRIAYDIGRLLQERGVIEHAGEVILIAHAQRDSDQKIRETLMDYAGKVFARAIETAKGEMARATSEEWRKR